MTDFPTMILKSDEPIDERTVTAFQDAMRRHPSGSALPAAEPARLQVMNLPNGRFLLVLDGWTGDTEDGVHMLNAACEEAGALVLRERVDVWGSPDVGDLAAATAEACAMTHGEGDEALISKVRGAYAAQAAEAEAWRLEGERAVEQVGHLRAMLDEIREVADDPAPNRDRVSIVSELAHAALRDRA